MIRIKGESLAVLIKQVEAQSMLITANASNSITVHLVTKCQYHQVV